MKALSINNEIFSRIKENLKGFLSIFDTTVEEEIQLPSELASSLETLNTNARDFETNGTLFNKNTGGTTKKHTNVNRIKPATIREFEKKEFTKTLDDEREI